MVVSVPEGWLLGAAISGSVVAYGVLGAICAGLHRRSVREGSLHDDPFVEVVITTFWPITLFAIWPTHWLIRKVAGR